MIQPSPKWVKRGIFLFLAGGILLGGLFISEFFLAPRMKVQPYYQPFETEMPMPPAGIVPVETWPVLPSEDREGDVRNPLQASEENILRGRVYYHYYCLFCHGVEGDGNGPVGQSYMPVPANLYAEKIQNYSDLRLLRAMLTGTGHAPVLERTIPPKYRWYLVTYLRNLEGRLPEEKTVEDAAEMEGNN